MRSFRPYPLILCALAVLVPAAHAEEEKQERSNELSAIVAGTHEDETTYFTLGVEYERDLGKWFALSAVTEVIVEGDSNREWILVFPAVFKPWGGLKLLAGPGFERAESTSFLFRIGAGWGFEIGERYSLAPTVELDFVDGDDGVDQVVVFGFSFGFGF